jgi:hypothetical protein
MASTIPVEPVSAGETSSGGYTIEQLKEHGTRESFWMLLHDKVYDVTAFLDEVSGLKICEGCSRTLGGQCMVLLSRFRS